MRTIKIQFPFNKDHVAFVRDIPHSRWHPKEKCWTIQNTQQIIRLLDEFIGDYKIIQPDKVTPHRLQHHTESIDRFIKWMEHRGYAFNTIKTYSKSIEIFLDFLKKDPHEIHQDDYLKFVIHYLKSKGLSRSYQNSLVNALKLFFTNLYPNQLDIQQLARPRKERKLPNVLSKNEIKRILDSMHNIKHRAAISLIYACGLRRSELLKIQLSDINSDRNLLHIRQSKSNKDRTVPIPNSILDLLREYYKYYKPLKFLFEGTSPGTMYSSESISKVLKVAVKKSKIIKPVTLHWLRHSYATHLLESGTDIRYIQELLGHSNSKTTEIYTHVSQKDLKKIKSPFDSL